MADARRSFTITRMRVAEFGEFEAYVSIADGPTVRVDRRYGSWQADVRPFPGARQTIRKGVAVAIARALQERARSMERSIACPTCEAPRRNECKGTFTSHRDRIRAVAHAASEPVDESEAYDVDTPTPVPSSTPDPAAIARQMAKAARAAVEAA